MSSAFTYKEWQDRGCVVMWGEKSHSSNAKGEPLFTMEQVREEHIEYDYDNWEYDDDVLYSDDHKYGWGD